MSVRVLRSPAKNRNKDVIQLDRKTGEDNFAWLQRAIKESLRGNYKNQSLLLLVGGNDPLSFRLRIAQCHVRHDLSPSAWSHVVFISALTGTMTGSETVEISLMPHDGFGRCGNPIPSNGIQVGRLDGYQSEKLFPNIALLSMPIPSSTIEASLAGMKFQRGVLDCPQLILKWLSYCWGVGVPASPLADGFGIPSAAVLEAAFAANGFDLTPGLESRSSCPEAIWQAANWWQDYYAKRRDGQSIRGAFSAKHELVPDDLYGNSPGPGDPDKKTRAK
jgi:hypothetical protein